MDGIIKARNRVTYTLFCVRGAVRVAQYTESELHEALNALRARVVTLEENQCLTEEQRRAQLIVLRIAQAAINVVWLTNGAVKNFGLPVGILIGIYAYGQDIAEQIVSYLRGLSK